MPTIDNAHLTYISHASEYNSECELKTVQFNNLSSSEFDSVLAFLLATHIKESNLQKILNSFGYFTNQQIKEVKDVLFTNEDFLYFAGTHAKIKDKLTASQIERIEKTEHVFAKVLIPQRWKIQIEEHKKNKEKLNAQKEEKKRQRKIKQAQKLLKEAGKI